MTIADSGSDGLGDWLLRLAKRRALTGRSASRRGSALRGSAVRQEPATSLEGTAELRVVHEVLGVPRGSLIRHLDPVLFEA